MNPPIRAEVGAVEYIPYGDGKGKWFSILGHGGMVTYSADQPEGQANSYRLIAKVLYRIHHSPI